MLERVLNKLGLYTRKQYKVLEFDVNFYKNELTWLEDDYWGCVKRFEKLEKENKDLIEELNKLKLKYARKVKGRKSYVK